MNRTLGQKVYDIIIQLALIVVGVLSALAVENYRESIQEHRTEKEYLVSLRNAVQADTAMLKREIERTFIKIRAISNLLASAKISALVEDEEFGDNITDVLMLIRPNFVTAVYEELKFTGNFKLIQNNELKADIISYYNDIAVIQQENDKSTTYPTELMRPITLEQLEFKSPFDQKGIYKALNGNQLAREELLQVQKSTHIVRTTMIYTSMPKCIELLEKLQTEVDK